MLIRGFSNTLLQRMFEGGKTNLLIVDAINDRVKYGSHTSWGCGFAVGTLTVDTDGKVYACHRLCSNKDFLLGSVETGIDHNKATVLRERTNVNFITGCRSCWARYYCSAGCVAENYEASGSISLSSFQQCYLYKKLIEAAIEKRLIDRSQKTEQNV